MSLLKKKSSGQSEHSFFETLSGARKEVERRTKRNAENNIVSRIKKSPYGDGYVVYSIPADVEIELRIDGINTSLGGFGFGQRTYG